MPSKSKISVKRIADRKDLTVSLTFTLAPNDKRNSRVFVALGNLIADLLPTQKERAEFMRQFEVAKAEAAK
jgi:hypothetical protein